MLKDKEDSEILDKTKTEQIVLVHTRLKEENKERTRMKWEIQLLKTNKEIYREKYRNPLESYDESVIIISYLMLYLILLTILKGVFPVWLVKFGIDNFLKELVLTFILFCVILYIDRCIGIFKYKNEYQLSANVDELRNYYTRVDENLLGEIEEKIKKKEYFLEDGRVLIRKAFYFPFFLDEKRFLKQAIKDSKVRKRKRKIKTIIR